VIAVLMFGAMQPALEKHCAEQMLLISACVCPLVFVAAPQGPVFPGHVVVMLASVTLKSFGNPIVTVS
jgi:hypothetical protein